MDGTVLPDVKEPRRGSGLLNGKSFDSDDLPRHLPVYHVPIRGAEPKAFPLAVSAVARIDRWSKVNSEDFPVIIAAGMSSGGDGDANRAMATMGLYSDLKIRTHLEEAFGLAVSNTNAAHEHNAIPAANRYHLVATSLFPWLTVKPWSELGLSPFEESMLHHGLGYDDPLIALKVLLTLFTETSGKGAVPWVVFHGSSPWIAITAIRFAQNRVVDGPDVLICDELIGTTPIQNSVVLHRPKLDRSHVETVSVDE